MNREKIKLTNGSIYEIVPGGINATEEFLKLIIIPGFKTLSEIDSEMDNFVNVQRIELLDADDDIMDIKKDYIYQTECTKKRDQVVDRIKHTEEVTEKVLMEVPVEGSETGETILKEVEQTMTIVTYEDVLGTVVVISLKKSDIRKELENLKEAVGMMLVTSLEG